MFESATVILSQLIQLLEQLPAEMYTKPSTSLAGGTIGQHTRHVIELYQCLINGYATAAINYDARKRDVSVEQQSDIALSLLKEIIASHQQPDKKIQLFYELNNNSVVISSNYYREIMHNIEHCIHHQALIKVALTEFGITCFSTDFGVAPSTIKYRQQCAQ